jgi:hypothetical protein
MFRSFFAPALVAVLMATTAPVNAAQVMVKDITVTVDLAVVTNPAAAKYWANLADELKAAISARLSDRISPDGMHVLVKVSSVGLMTGFENATGAPDPHLIANVNIVGEPQGSTAGGNSTTTAHQDSAYELTITFKDSEAFVPAGVDVITITPDKKEYHDAMITAFADYVAKHL